MKAIVFDHHGGIEVLKYREIPEPEIRESEVLIQVKACALNHLDIWTRQGLPGIQIPLPHILGCESAGVVEKAGSQVRNVKVGDSVLIAPGVFCGHCEFCRRGRESLCAEFQIMGFQVNGGYAEYVTAPARNAIQISTQKLSFEEWAATPLCFLTAYHMLFTRGQIQKGERVLIQAAGSGVGSAAIQLAKHAGAFVITTAGNEEKLKKAKKLGADEGINYAKEDVVNQVKRLSRGKGVDLILDHVGPATWSQMMASLAKGGRLVTCGATTGREVQLDLRLFFTRELSVSGCYMGASQELKKVLQWIKQGKVKPVIDSVFPLQEAAKAQEKMEYRDCFGKLVLRP